MRTHTLAVTVLALAFAATGCATRGYVRDRTGEVNTKVETLSKTVEDTQEATRQNSARITEVGEKTEAAARSAEEARNAATTADRKAAEAGELAAAVDRASRKLVYEVVLSENKGNFRFGQTSLPDDAKTEIDKLVEQLKTNPQGGWIEIEGHTDSVGGRAVNERIGLQRAEEVKMYLYEAHQVPLHKMNVISYGEEKPIAPNNTRDGRAQNRRVVIRVLI